jgi:hypothetical protein
MKRIKLYDFNLYLAVLIVVAYLMMSVLAAMLIAFKPALRTAAIVGAALIIVSFSMLIWYFVIMAPRLSEVGIIQGKKAIKKENVVWKTEYNERFKERQLIIRDATVNYNKLDDKEIARRQFVVQCTAQNERKIAEYLNGNV